MKTIYTPEQSAALERMKEPGLSIGAARPEFVNHLLMPDGSVLSDHAEIRALAAAEDERREAALRSLLSQHSAAINSVAGPTSDVAQAIANARARARHSMVDELDAHYDEGRFLFVVGASMLNPDVEAFEIVYFQCAVPGNEDVFPPAPPPLLAGVTALSLVLFAGLLHAIWPAAHAGWYVLAMGTLDFKGSTAAYALDQLYDNKFPASSLLYLRTGSPAGADNAAGGSLLCTITTPSSPWAASTTANPAVKAKQNTWSNAASGTGTVGHFRLTNAADTEREEGTVTITGGGGDMTVDSTSITAAQVVTVSTYSRSL